MRVLGIDFGTSNTVAMLRTPDGRVRPLLFDGSPLLPSAVYLGTDGRMVVGRDAERNARVDPGRFEPNPKRRVDDGTIFLGDRELSVPEVFATVLGTVANEARRRNMTALTISPESRNVDAIRSLHAAGYDVVSSIELTMDLDRHAHEWQQDGLELHELQFRS